MKAQLLITALVSVGCSGGQGPAGPDGPDGPAGSAGSAGSTDPADPAGAAAPEVVAVAPQPEFCAVCHSEAGAEHQASYDELYQGGVITVTDLAYSFSSN